MTPAQTPIIGPLAEAMSGAVVAMIVLGAGLATLTLLFVHWLKHRHDRFDG